MASYTAATSERVSRTASKARALATVTTCTEESGIAFIRTSTKAPAKGSGAVWSKALASETNLWFLGRHLE